MSKAKVSPTKKKAVKKKKAKAITPVTRARRRVRELELELQELTWESRDDVQANRNRELRAEALRLADQNAWHVHQRNEILRILHEKMPDDFRDEEGEI